MKIIILGAGRVGQSVADSLVSERNDITVIDTDAAGDTFAPALDARWTRTDVDPATGAHQSRTGPAYRYERWERQDRP